ncbi:hypothetical protein XFF6991_450008 [Xanthomonas phaseoli pv. phaseoli]|uniref:Uncharacterized protein n=1 Tax=Xanthomonas campestris pv. phaseoli TaxID=317013 RepID=A0A7Z7J122_XANCH|nr:hypothetical protein XFF6991_450008 [Xanthomonas phaseoli pv. phaseoli]
MSHFGASKCDAKCDAGQPVSHFRKPLIFMPKSS